MQNKDRQIQALHQEIIELKAIIAADYKPNPHKMDRSKVHLLIKIGKLNKAGHEWIKIQQDSSLIKDDERPRTIQCDAVHANRLKWFGLIDLKTKRSGEYKINSKGIAFLLNKYAVPSLIWCKKGHVIKEGTYNVYLRQIKNVILDKEYWDNYPLNECAGRENF